MYPVSLNPHYHHMEDVSTCLHTANRESPVFLKTTVFRNTDVLEFLMFLGMFVQTILTEDLPAAAREACSNPIYPSYYLFVKMLYICSM